MVTRPKAGAKGDTPSESYYIETVSYSGREFSCSFIEFDGMGDYLLFEQHENSWKKLLNLVEQARVLLVVYCHGWKNNSQSADVLRFNAFLCQLANTAWVAKENFRVHGVFLAWRGASVKHNDPGAEDAALNEKLTACFGRPIVDRKWSQWLPRWIAFLPQQFSYWGRKAAAERDVSGAPISRTIFSLAYLLYRHRVRDREHQIVLIGHSMGALILEQSLANASIGKVMADWPWFTDTTRWKKGEYVLPFDLILLLNSAAPSIYAKQMRDFLAADYAVRKAAGLDRPERPVIISVTSAADWATGVLHRVGNLFSCFAPQLQRIYWDPQTGEKIGQSYFYSRTPGHNRRLINRYIDPSVLPALPAGEQPFEANVTPVPGVPCAFYTSPRSSSVKSPDGWKVVKASSHQPTPGDTWRDKANYWIVNVPKALIRNHGDIWSQQCMEMMVALWRIADE